VDVDKTPDGTLV